MRCNFNELNLRKKLTNARGQDINFTYDLNGRIKTYSTPEDVVSFDYDDNGNMLCNGSLLCGYDSLNRLVYAGDYDYIYNAEN